MRIWSLGSGSGGNATLLESGDTRVLLDAGFGLRGLAARLSRIGVAPASISALVISHEHDDHARGAARAAAKWGWEMHSTRGTAAGHRELRRAAPRPLQCGVPLKVGDLELNAVPISHDAREPVAFVATCMGSGARAGIAYDLGVVTRSLREAFARVDLLVIESNHDDDMLRFGPYPPVVQARIAGKRGHLSNTAAQLFAQECAHAGMKEILLAHLSERCNRPRLALEGMRRALARTAFRGRVSLSWQDQVAGPVEGGRRGWSGVQLELFQPPAPPPPFPPEYP